MIAVSACLAGENCTNKGTNKTIPKIKDLVNKKRAIKICPECLGGLSVPREYAEIVNGEGIDVVEGKARVLNRRGKDITVAFLKGAKASFDIAKKFGAEYAIFRSGSPSCGCGKIYNGTFSGKCKKGDGVTTAFFKQNGVSVVAEKDWAGE